MPRTVQLLIIDPQNDFCDLPAGPQGTPALPVAGADADMQRLAAFIDQAGDALDEITVTLDSHHRLDIAHPTFWQTRDGGAVSPFTPITAAQVRAGEYAPRQPAALPRALAYLNALEARGRYTLMVWPVHCEIGSWGHNVHTAVRQAYNRWEERRQAIVRKVNKGSNPWTEHYSAVQAEVPDATDADTQLNRALIEALDRSDLLLIAGEASSHCVKASTEHIVQHLPGGRPERLLLLTDCMSPVGGFEAQATGFLATMRAKGVRTATSAEALQLLKQ
ncbi:cysteine hydrolase [Aquabacterium sp.]|uniref:cysteine hydrolase n=1 Tax=Aquabacterium sp. TaxID=1872578 RepID=UPI0037851069